jgi:hypothetical protein
VPAERKAFEVQRQAMVSQLRALPVKE